MYLTTSPKLLRYLMPRGLIWEIPERENVLYLTFDDGPVSGVTDIVLEILDRFDAKATFFCVGNNVRKHPDVYRRIINAGHATGNHTFDHLNGWKVTTERYVNDVKRCREYVNSNLFRPPYGRITRQQAKTLSNDYHIIMWSVMSGDFDPGIESEKCLENITRSTKPGSIVVMHDKEKPTATMPAMLNSVLEYYFSNGFRFNKLEV